MTTDGGGWIQLALSSAGSDAVYRTIPIDSNSGILRPGDQARYFQHLPIDGFTDVEHYHDANNIGANLVEFDITYQNPATGIDFSADELQALRAYITELSTETLMVAGAVDDSCYYSGANQGAGDLGHEIYISNGQGTDFINLTYGTQPDDEQDSFVLYHTSSQFTVTDNVSLYCGGNSLSYLEIDYLIPAKIQLGWANSNTSQWGGAAYWGWEQNYFLVK